TDSMRNTINNILQIIKLPKLILGNQPTRFWHNRELATLGKGCPAIQVEGSPQRTPILLELPQEIKNYREKFYIGTHARTYNGNDHTQKLILPTKTKVKKVHKTMPNNLECLIFDDQQKHFVEFDSNSRGVFSRINSQDLECLQKKLTLNMVNLYQITNNDKETIKEDKLIWCRLMFAIYIKLPNGQFERISLPTYSDLIEETHATQSFTFNTSVFPDKFCERGGQMIFIQLKEKVKKDDLYVHCNGKLLNQNDFQVDKTILSFESPAIMQKRSTVEITIRIANIPSYDHPEPCGVINQD
ncbi:unnamed protein product, partial [Rotaria sp. Silwood2]